MQNLLENEKFEIYYNMLIETNKQFNLTRIVDKQDAYEKHFYDCVQAEKFIQQNSKVVDVGSGAGFPAIPLKIIRPDINITMIDSLNKRINFLNEVCQKLCFNNYSAEHFTAEEYSKNFREIFDVGVARAVAPLRTLCELISPLVKVGGKLLLYKGSNFQEELNESKNAFKELNLKLKNVYEYDLPICKQKRVILEIEKFDKTPKKYPRSQNKPRNLPL